MKRILVTGATGGLGMNAVQSLLEKGVPVRATGRNVEVGKVLADMGAQFLPLDLASASQQQLAELMADVETVWHCAALSSPWGRMKDFIAANVTATWQLVEAAGAAGVFRFVHISTPAIYFNYTNHLQIPETFRPEKYVNAYAHTKAGAEYIVQRAVRQFPAMRTVILRPRAIFGPHDNVLIPRLDRVLRQRGGSLPLPAGGAAVIDVTYVENVVHAMWLATTKDELASGSVFNITNHEPTSLRDIVQRLFHEELERPCRIVAFPYSLLSGVASCMQLLSRLTRKEPSLTSYSLGAMHYSMTLDNTRAITELGYQPPVSLTEGIRRTAQWMRQHG